MSNLIIYDVDGKSYSAVLIDGVFLAASLIVSAFMLYCFSVNKYCCC